MQDTYKPLFEVAEFKGMDNLTPDYMKLPPGYFKVFNNIDIDDDEMIHRRGGISYSLDSGSWHSLWANEDVCYGIRNNALVQINKVVRGRWKTDFTYTVILNAVGSSPMDFLQIEGDDRVFFSNLDVIGYILDGTAYGFPDPTREARQKMVGGELIEYHNARLYTAQGDVIFFSIAGNPFEMDLEKNFIPIGGPITMLKSVIGGMYVSAGDKVVFLAGPDLFSGSKVTLLYTPALKGSATVTDQVFESGERGKVVIFSTVDGIFMGYPDGNLVNLTGSHYGGEEAESGSAMIKWDRGYSQYVYLSTALASVGSLTINAIDPIETASIH